MGKLKLAMTFLQEMNISLADLVGGPEDFIHKKEENGLALQA